jgi:hypothetical protein
MPSRMRERICEMSYSSLSSNNPQFLVCNFATGWMKLLSGWTVGRKESESERWAVHMIVKTLGSAWLLLEIHWQKGRQADRLCTCTRRLPTFLAGPSNFLPALRNFVQKLPYVGSTYPSSFSLKRTLV